MHVLPTLAAAAVAALLPLAAAAAATPLQFAYEWEHVVDGITLRWQPYTERALTSGALLAREEDALTGAGAGAGNGTVLATGHIDAARRRFGVGARAESWVNPWNPQTDLPQSPRSEVRAGIRFSDTLFAFSPSVLPGDPLVFAIQPALLSGALSVPPVDALALGSARLLLTLTVAQVTPATVAPQVYTLERSVPVGNDHQINGFEFITDMPLFYVANFKAYTFTLEMSVAAGATASPLWPDAPERAVALADFSHTLVWNGIAGITDVDGRLLGDVQIQSEQGFDWRTVTAVPEPGTWALWLGGLAMLTRVMRRPARRG